MVRGNSKASKKQSASQNSDGNEHPKVEKDDDSIVPDDEGKLDTDSEEFPKIEENDATPEVASDEESDEEEVWDIIRVIPQQLQMQLYGQTSPWNVGVAYRIPDTNFNLQGTYQQGRANVQLSCVPDEYAPFLGPNGFTNGVGPGNLGLSLNLSV